MKSVYNKLKMNYFRVISLILCFSLLITCMEISVFSIDNERKNHLNEWLVEVAWNGTDLDEYTITSEENEKLRPKMVIKYYASQAERDYSPGEVKFTMGGLDDIERNNTIAASTTMEKTDSKWELIESGNHNEYVFANRVEIKRGESLSGGFEIMWEFQSREAYNGYSKTITPVFSVKNTNDEFESITLPDLTFNYHSERDFYYLNIETKNITSEEYEDVMGIGSDGQPTEYERDTWYKETIKFNPQIRARGADVSELFVAVKVIDSDDPETGNEIPQSAYEDVQVLRNNGSRTTLQAYDLYEITHQESDRNKTVYGYYEFTDRIGDLSNDEYVFYLGYPYEDNSGAYISTFDNKYTYVKSYLSVLYKDETDYIRLNSHMLEHENIVASAIKKNEYYGFSYRGGEYSHYQYNDLYEIVDMKDKGGDHKAPPQFSKLISAQVYMSKTIYFDLEMNARREYTSSSSSTRTNVIHSTSTGAGTNSVNVSAAEPPVGRNEGVYLEEGIDRLSVELEDGSLRRLQTDEYDISVITVPKDEYNRKYKIFVTDTPDIPYEDYEYFDEGETNSEKTFMLPREKYCGFYVKMEDVNGTYTKIASVGIRFHLRDDMSPAIDPNGKLISFSFFRVLYTDENDGQEKLYTQVEQGDYKGEYTQTIAADDMATQGEYVYRRYSNVFLREPIVHLTSRTMTTDIEREEGEEYIKAIDDIYGGGYTFLVSTDGEVVADIVGDLRKFSIHTLLPKELVPNEDLSEIRYNSTDVLEGIKVDGKVLLAAEIPGVEYALRPVFYTGAGYGA